MILLSLCHLVLLSFYLTDAACPAGDDNPTNSSSPSYISLVQSVSWPGTKFVPSTGKLLVVLHLNSSHLSGRFVSHSGVLLYFTSTSSGNFHVRRSDGSTMMEHDFVSQKRQIHFAKIEDHPFVYDTQSRAATYRLPLHRRSRRDMESEYDERRGSGQNHRNDNEEMRAALIELSLDPQAHLLAKLSQALAEFGIYGKDSPASLPLHMTAMSVARHLATNTTEETLDMESFACAEQRLTKSASIPSRSRQRRGWLSKAVRKTVNVVRRVVEPIVGAIKRCNSLQHDPKRNNCLGMCGRRCSCWRWVCGNCCWNRGCYQHDRCCQRGVVFCWIPIGFNCNSYAQYPYCLRWG